MSEGRRNYNNSRRSDSARKDCRTKKRPGILPGETGHLSEGRRNYNNSRRSDSARKDCRTKKRLGILPVERHCPKGGGTIIKKGIKIHEYSIVMD
nr:hypothetical protein [uncultured Acetatifactor sp.]